MKENAALRNSAKREVLDYLVGGGGIREKGVGLGGEEGVEENRGH